MECRWLSPSWVWFQILAAAQASALPPGWEEGNYLLLEVAHWARVREQLDEVWFVDTDDELRRDRLVQRHIRFGRTPQAAREWVARTDEPNARLVAASRHRADVQFRWDGD